MKKLPKEFAVLKEALEKEAKEPLQERLKRRIERQLYEMWLYGYVDFPDGSRLVALEQEGGEMSDKDRRIGELTYALEKAVSAIAGQGWYGYEDLLRELRSVLDHRQTGESPRFAALNGEVVETTGNWWHCDACHSWSRRRDKCFQCGKTELDMASQQIRALRTNCLPDAIIDHAIEHGESSS